MRVRSTGPRHARIACCAKPGRAGRNSLHATCSSFCVSCGHSGRAAARYTPAFCGKTHPPFMVAVPSAHLPAVFDLKSASLTLVALVLKTTDLEVLAQAFEARFGDTPGLFDRDPVVVDLGVVADAPEPIDFAALVALLTRYKLQPVAAKAGSAVQMEAALAAGLVEAQMDGPSPPRAV